MRQEVQEFIMLGSLPEETASEQQISKYESALAQIAAPVTDEEARALVGSFGSDDCYGLAWTLLHLIETSPNWPLRDVLDNTHNEWIQRLRRRAKIESLPARQEG